MIDVAVLGGGLAGLSAARDLVRAGAEVLVLEAGGEVFGRGHVAYAELVRELGSRSSPATPRIPER